MKKRINRSGDIVTMDVSGMVAYSAVVIEDSGLGYMDAHIARGRDAVNMILGIAETCKQASIEEGLPQAARVMDMIIDILRAEAGAKIRTIDMRHDK